MKKGPLQAQLTTSELEAKLNAIKKIHAVIIGIFVLILLVWVLLGHWKENVAVFISTIMMTVAITSLLIASRSSLNDELKKRRSETGDAEPSDERGSE